ncbi:unnamed protein product [Brassica rapa]|uniref:Secreted protein n=1 Tax=Brassica campestris TaxID=3711 RepID=A0A8D9HRZ3_BRACM|nr:unnamed protein product [Brassica rapa]
MDRRGCGGTITKMCLCLFLLLFSPEISFVSAIRVRKSSCVSLCLLLLFFSLIKHKTHLEALLKTFPISSFLTRLPVFSEGFHAIGARRSRSRRGHIASTKP